MVTDSAPSAAKVIVDGDDVGVDEHQIVRVAVKAVLLDLDGVLVDSIGLVEQHWSQWAERRGLDTAAVLRAVARLR